MMRFKGAEKVKSWGQEIAKRCFGRKAFVALARKLAVFIHALWSASTFYVGDRLEQLCEGRRLLGAHR